MRRDQLATHLEDQAEEALRHSLIHEAGLLAKVAEIVRNGAAAWAQHELRKADLRRQLEELERGDC